MIDVPAGAGSGRPGRAAGIAERTGAIARSFRRPQRTPEIRRNERIRVSPVRLIDAAGDQVGVVEIQDAQQRAREAGLDLVEVAPTAEPPVCRIMDYGKYKYDLKKKERRAKSIRHETEMKEVRIRTPKIGAHDLEIKVNRAREFLERGDRVQFTLRFRGREMAHQDLGRDVLNSIKETLGDVSKVERDFRMEGRRLTMVLASTVKAPHQKRPAAAKPQADGQPAPAEATSPSAEPTPQPAPTEAISPPAVEPAAEESPIPPAVEPAPEESPIPPAVEPAPDEPPIPPAVEPAAEEPPIPPTVEPAADEPPAASAGPAS